MDGLHAKRTGILQSHSIKSRLLTLLKKSNIRKDVKNLLVILSEAHSDFMIYCFKGTPHPIKPHKSPKIQVRFIRI